MAKKIKFTEKAIQNLPTPERVRYQIYRDCDPPRAKRLEAVTGLQLYVYKSGVKSFVLCKKFHGKTRFLAIGKFPDLSVNRAREEARDLISSIRRGIDPLKRKRAETRKSVTLEQVFREYIDVRGRLLSENTKSNYKTVVFKHLGCWRNKELRDISRAMVQRKHADLTDISPSSANKAMRVLRALFNFANGQYEDHEGKGLFPDNPVRRISHVRAWNREERRQNKLNNSDLKPWFAAVSANCEEGSYSATVRDYLVMLLLTGMRRRELSPLKWCDVNLKDRIVTVGKTKNGDPLMLPLSDYLYDLLRNRQSVACGDYVFPGGLGNPYISEPRKNIEKLRVDTGIYFTLHDLRRTFITIAESLDIPAFALKKLINHRAKGGVTEGYIVMSVERLRKPMQQVTDHILSLAEIRTTCHTVSFQNEKIG